MRTHEFTFKKTITQKFAAISVDLTVDDAKCMLFVVRAAHNLPSAACAVLLRELECSLRDFLAKQGVYVDYIDNCVDPAPFAVVNNR